MAVDAPDVDGAVVPVVGDFVGGAGGAATDASAVAGLDHADGDGVALGEAGQQGDDARVHAGVAQVGGALGVDVHGGVGDQGLGVGVDVADGAGRPGGAVAG